MGCGRKPDRCTAPVRFDDRNDNGWSLANVLLPVAQLEKPSGDQDIPGHHQ
jgi:hypothetical protein